MVSITEIQEAIRVLPETEYARLRQWISDLDWERWDGQIEADAEAGRLDFLIAEAREARDTTTAPALTPYPQRGADPHAIPSRLFATSSSATISDGGCAFAPRTSR